MIVATAGHVDHGKTRLVQALTGVDTDTLAEEKRRGLTIDIGFAYLPVAGALDIGFIDVPGHERFIRNALCGLGAADVVLLVVAADDGPMPQTREHLAIVDLLGFRHGAIVISKCDRVTAPRIDRVRQELQTLCAGSGLRDWPTFVLSALSGQGVAALQGWLLARAQQRDAATGENAVAVDDSPLRMPVDRVFEIRGTGLVVTGTLFAGEVRPGDSVTIAGSDLQLRVRGLRVHDAESDCGRRGQRCALNLAGPGLRKELIKRGCWVTSAQAAAPVERFDARIRIVNDSPRALRHWAPVHLHLAAAESSARVALLEGAALAAGQQGLVQLVSKRPLGAACGDYLIIRDQSARHTLGGGQVLDIFPPLRGRARPHRLQWLHNMAREPVEAAFRGLLASSANGVDLAQFAANRNLGESRLEAMLQVAAPVVLQIDGRRLGFAEAVVAAHEDAILQGLQLCHRERPDAAGFSIETLLARIDKRMSRGALHALLERLRQQGQIDVNGAGYMLAGWQALPGPQESAHWQAIEAALAENGLRPLTLEELSQATRLPNAQLKPLIDQSSRAGKLVRLSPRLLLLPRQLERLQQLVQQLQAAAGDGLFSVAQFRDASDIGRNRCIELLESLDARGITRRDGQGRRLLPAADDLFARLQPAAQ
jgi:selenocysteine-specific elongation factor